MSLSYSGVRRSRADDEDIARNPPEDDGMLSDDEVDEGVSSSEKPTARYPVANRSSEDRRRLDSETLHAEEEAERLLHPGDGGRRKGLFAELGEKTIPRRAGRRARGRRKDGEEGELIFKVEEGPESGRSDSSGSEDARNLKEVLEKRRRGKKGRFARFATIHVVIIVAFFALLYGAYRATRASNEERERERTLPLWNGTHAFGPTTIVISLDGFRADFLQRNITPAMSGFVRDGVSPKYMMPSFPSLTFPNHYTLATGHYPESHGIVGNSFWDPVTLKEFYYTDPSRSMTPEWWNAEPIWVTAELQGIRSAIHMWPGSEAHIPPAAPTYVDEFKMDEPLDKKIDRVIRWLDLPGPDDSGFSKDTPRPQLIAFYVPDVDSDGHNFGPNSTEIQTTIASVDAMLDSLFIGIEARNLTEIVNIIVVSDHGMATTDSSRLLQYEDLLDHTLIEHTDGWPLYGLRPYDHSEAHLHEIYQSLVLKSQRPEYANTFDVYLRDVDMPERYHFSNNPRIAPLWIVPKPGWAIVTKEEFNVVVGKAENQIYHPRGLHGYDHEHPLMRAIFVARGPAFPHPKGSRVPPFQNIELYNIVCDSLGIQPRPNNGTIRLPFQAVFSGDDGFEPVDDLPGADDALAAILPPDLPGVENLPGSHGDPDDGSVNDEGAEEKSGFQKWLDWFKGKYEDAKDWATGIVSGGNRHNDADDGNNDDSKETGR